MMDFKLIWEAIKLTVTDCGLWSFLIVSGWFCVVANSWSLGITVPVLIILAVTWDDIYIKAKEYLKLPLEPYKFKLMCLLVHFMGFSALYVLGYGYVGHLIALLCANLIGFLGLEVCRGGMVRWI